MQIEVDYPIECAAQCADILGEVPLWCERTQKLWWVDVRRPALQSYAPSTQHYQAIRLHPDWVRALMPSEMRAVFYWPPQWVSTSLIPIL